VNTGLFRYGIADAIEDIGSRTSSRAKLELAHVANGAFNLGYLLATNGPGGNVQMPPDLWSDTGGWNGPSATAVVTPAVPLCSPFGCVIVPPVMMPGIPGYRPSNALLSSNQNDSPDKVRDAVSPSDSITNGQKGLSSAVTPGVNGANSASVADTGVVNLPKGYLASADGKITGPRGGMYSPTSAFDGSGNPIFIDSTGNYYKLTSSGVSRVVSPNPASSIGVTGEIGESALKSLGGQSQVSLPTTKGGRVIDQLTLDGIANEAKVGYTTLDASTALQVSKDAELLQTKAVKGVTWNFYSSPVTGQGGPSSALLKALSAAGIKVNIH
jgi:filamentous hemagglutinin